MLGFGKKETFVLCVEGMMCQRCAAHVKNALEGVKGVKSATIDLEAKTATVEASAGVGVDALTAAVVAVGYEVK